MGPKIPNISDRRVSYTTMKNFLIVVIKILGIIIIYVLKESICYKFDERDTTNCSNNNII